MRAARAVLAQDELDLGTDVAGYGRITQPVWRRFSGDGRLGCFSSGCHMGGQHVTNDIAHGLSTTVVHAERLKTLFGTVLGQWS